MQDAAANPTELHLPERWAVLEQALRQMNAEDAAQRRKGFLDEEDSPRAEATPHMR